MNQHNGQLRAIVERVERLNEEEAQIKADKREIFSEAKANGFDPKVLRRVIAIRAGDASAHEEFEALVATYMAALGGSHARDTRETAEEALSPTARIDGVAGARPEQVADDRGPPPAPRLPAQSAKVGAAGDGVQAVGAAPVHQPDEFPDIPAFLDRRRPIAPQPGEPLR